LPMPPLPCRMKWTVFCI